MGKHVDNSAEQPARRRLLRAGGAAVAGVVGAGVASSLAASPASAAPGDSLTLGQSNNAGATSTQLTSSAAVSTGATLALGNTNAADDGSGLIVTGPSLQLVPNGDYADGPLGSLGVSSDGALWLKNDPNFAPDYVRTTFNTTTVVPLKPQRALDTLRNRTNVISDAGTVFDASSRLVGGHWLHLNLVRYFGGATVLFANVNVLGSSSAGWVAVVPYKGTGTPTTSTINFAAGQSISNGLVVGVGWDNPRGTGVIDAVSIYASVNVRIILDLTAVTVWDQFSQIDQAILIGAAPASGAAVTPQLTEALAARGFNVRSAKPTS